MPLGYREFSVLLRHTSPATPATDGSPDFVAIVSAKDAAGAQAEAEKLVETLNRLVSIVSIEPRPTDERPDLRLM